jgi:hypothetical protein
VLGALLGGLTVLAATGDASAVYHYRDGHGVDHYVNHPEQVPAGTAADKLKLTEDLNPQLAQEMAQSAHRAAEEAKAKAAEAARLRAAEEAAKGLPPEPLTGRPAPPEARWMLVWSIAFTVVFLVLWSVRGLLVRRSPALALAFQPVRWGTGGAAVFSWILLAILARGWIADRFPPLRAIARTRTNVDKINREQKEAEHELDKALNAH